MKKCNPADVSISLTQLESVVSYFYFFPIGNIENIAEKAGNSSMYYSFLFLSSQNSFLSERKRKLSIFGSFWLLASTSSLITTFPCPSPSLSSTPVYGNSGSLSVRVWKDEEKVSSSRTMGQRMGPENMI